MTRKQFGMWIVVAALAITATPAIAECDAEVRGELRKEETGDETGGVGMRYTFAVDVETQDSCAVVRFSLFARIQQSDGSEVTRTKPGRVRLSGGSTTYMMRYDVPPDDEMMDWEIKMTSCDACTLLAPE